MRYLTVCATSLLVTAEHRHLTCNMQLYEYREWLSFQIVPGVKPLNFLGRGTGKGIGKIPMVMCTPHPSRWFNSTILLLYHPDHCSVLPYYMSHSVGVVCRARGRERTPRARNRPMLCRTCSPACMRRFLLMLGLCCWVALTACTPTPQPPSLTC
jgi:hypothetical protein